jgi:hypothetical protein
MFIMIFLVMFDDAKITQRLKLQKKICLSVFFSVHLFSKKGKRFKRL